ncbi:nudix (nucleoside diphosphate linked moiety X)-type motif 4a isoform X1 [Gadus morhua]|nr:diphosphoinositol polyphosphate phosphohydrolase 3-beta-like isoform X1 [Gadus morhua]XP_030220966.1 diphosphoinositol polyphosphate phosphohydrolase 3-beta-like isoform X1 [Gadus morhua]XP_030220967.1 diphosphoinositol polyphosphate phosphohydrolase 3-beta-like isoform X1 [Gadus morhua]XP_030220968.1 diphosphoinositol polyphosphate phosphohydrolase 3-beta-like isoform X1 [Gadus morhua]
MVLCWAGYAMHSTWGKDTIVHVELKYILDLVDLRLMRGGMGDKYFVLLVSSSRHPDQWIVPGGGMEPEEEPGGAAVREVYEEAGVKGKLGRLLGVFEHNQDRKHRTFVYVLTVTETLDDWEDSVTIGRKRKWFKIDDALQVLQNHKPVHAEYLIRLTTAACGAPCSPSCADRNGNSPVSALTHNSSPHHGLSTHIIDNTESHQAGLNWT